MGTVRIAQHKSDRRLCAIKCMSKTELLDHKDESRVFSEKEIMRLMDHPFIVKYFGSFQVLYLIFAS